MNSVAVLLPKLKADDVHNLFPLSSCPPSKEKSIHLYCETGAELVKQISSAGGLIDVKVIVLS